MSLTDQERWDRKQRAYIRRKALQEKAINYLGGKCQICGYDKCTSAMDFHHRDPNGKDFNISTALTSWKRIEKELDKCELLCSRCHREVHDGGMHPGHIELDGSLATPLLWDDPWDD